MTPPRRPKLIFALTDLAIEVWARPRGFRPSDVVHVLADPHRHLRGRNFTTADLVHLNRASEHANFKEAVSFLGRIPLPEPVDPCAPPMPITALPVCPRCTTPFRLHQNGAPTPVHAEPWSDEACAGATRPLILAELRANRDGSRVWLSPPPAACQETP